MLLKMLRVDGRIWKGDLKTGKGQVVVPAAGGGVGGLAYDKRSKYLFVCGGFSGEAQTARAALFRQGALSVD